MDTSVMVGSRDHVNERFTFLHMYIIVNLCCMDSRLQNPHSLPLEVIFATVYFTGLTR